MTRGISPKVRSRVIERDGGLCRRCGRRGEQVHHRRPRGNGGTSLPWVNRPANLVTLCAACHLHIEQNRGAAYEQGWLIPYSAENATDTPIRWMGMETFLLNDGTVQESSWA